MHMRPNRSTSYPKGSMSAYVKRSLIRMVRLWILLFLLPLDVVWATSAPMSNYNSADRRSSLHRSSGTKIDYKNSLIKRLRIPFFT